MSWEDYLPPFIAKPIHPRYRGFSPTLGGAAFMSAPVLIVVHKTIGDKDDGSDAASTCVSRSNAGGVGVWHWTVGFTGTAYRHAEWTRILSHAGGINSKGPGIEHDLGVGDKPSEAMLRTSAKIIAAYAHFIDRRPNRDWVIGHIEDNLPTRFMAEGSNFTRWGGDSNHTDPDTLGKPPWPWDRHMDYIIEAYEGGDMTPEQTQTLVDAKAFLDALTESLGKKDAPDKPANPGGAGKRVAAATLQAEATP